MSRMLDDDVMLVRQITFDTMEFKYDAARHAPPPPPCAAPPATADAVRAALASVGNVADRARRGGGGGGDAGVKLSLCHAHLAVSNAVAGANGRSAYALFLQGASRGRRSS